MTSPRAWLTRRVLFPAWTFKDGSRQLRYLREFERLQWLPREELERRQLGRLGRILRHAGARSPHYRRVFAAAGFDPASCSDARQLRRLPVLTKEEIRGSRGALLAEGQDPARMIEYKTGGSTGTSLTVYGDYDALDRGLAAAYLCYRWAGWEIGEPMGRVWGNPPLPRTLKERLRNALLQPVVWLDTVDLGEERMRRFVADWRRVRPSLLHGHAHSLYELAAFLEREGIDAVRPAGVISTSMMLRPSERAVIERVLGVRVTDLYGCEEVGLIACECERHEGLHVNALNLHLEVLRDDGEPAAPGETGSVVVTSLINEAMPIIRYRVEDRAALAPGPCGCGRGLPLLLQVAGRDADFLVKADGSLVQGISLIERTLTEIPGLAQMQIVQEALDRLVVNLVPGEGYGEDARKRLVGELQAVFGPSVAVEVRTVARIPQEPSGKYQFAICRVRERPGP